MEQNQSKPVPSIGNSTNLKRQPTVLQFNFSGTRTKKKRKTINPKSRIALCPESLTHCASLLRRINTPRTKVRHLDGTSSLACHLSQTALTYNSGTWVGACWVYAYARRTKEKKNTQQPAGRSEPLHQRFQISSKAERFFLRA